MSSWSESNFESNHLSSNADQLRLKEYATLLDEISNYIKNIEIPKAKIAIDVYSCSIDVIDSSLYAIPESVTELVGEVQYIDVTLHNTDNRLITNKPTGAQFENEEPRKASISVELQGENSSYYISRSSLEDNKAECDVLYKASQVENEPEYINPITQAEFNRLIFSITSPLDYSVKENKQRADAADFLNPDNFNNVIELFKLTTPANDNYGYTFSDQDTVLRYFKTDNLVDNNDMPSCQIEFTSIEYNRLEVNLNLDTEFSLSFNLISGDENQPYIPTLDEIRYLKEIIAQENKIITLVTKNDTLELSELSDIPEEVNYIDTAIDDISDDQDFNKIASSYNNKEFEEITKNF